MEDRLMALRLQAVENAIQDLKNHDHEIVNSVNSILETVKIINSNVERVTDSACQLYERLMVLEKDMTERSTKKKFIKSLIGLYPILMVFMIWVIDSDHHAISQVASDVNSIVKDAKSLTMYADNYTLGE